MVSYFNTFNDNSTANGLVNHANHCTFNPLDKLMESVEENKKLYERLLQSEKDKKPKDSWIVIYKAKKTQSHLTLRFTRIDF